jgi:hypothetical protein
MKVDLEVLKRRYPVWKWRGVRDGFGWNYEGTRDDRRVLVYPASVLSGFTDDEFVTVWMVVEAGQTERIGLWTGAKPPEPRFANLG